MGGSLELYRQSHCSIHPVILFILTSNKRERNMNILGALLGMVTFASVTALMGATASIPLVLAVGLWCLCSD